MKNKKDIQDLRELGVGEIMVGLLLASIISIAIVIAIEVGALL